MRKIIILILVAILTSGCAVGYMSSSTYDPHTGKRSDTIYSPLFSTDSIPLADGAEFRVSVVITRIVEPLSHSMLSVIGGLTLDDMVSKATAVVHFKNDSKQIYKINLKKIIVLNQEFLVKVPEVVLKSGTRFDTKTIAVKAPTYDTTFDLTLDYELDGKSFIQNFPMRRETMEEIEKHKENERLKNNKRIKGTD